jgi:hypothetical protein
LPLLPPFPLLELLLFATSTLLGSFLLLPLLTVGFCDVCAQASPTKRAANSSASAVEERIVEKGLETYEKQNFSPKKDEKNA